MTWIVAVTSVLCAVLTVTAMCLGDYVLSPGEVLAALLDPDAGFARTVVVEWRLPRILAALCFGAALAVSGAIFQTVTANPLGSPDVIGFSTGAYTGAIITIALAGQSPVSSTGGALLGGFATAAVVALLALRRGAPGMRLILVGIGVTAMLHALNTWLLLRLQPEVAMSASIWGVGSLSLVDWEDLLPAVVVIVAALVAMVFLRSDLRQLELGDDAATAHGVRPSRARLAILAIGVALTATATAVTGPIAFIALTAPQIASRISRSAGIPLVASALVGATMLLVADTLVQRLLPDGVPVGVATIVLGGAYLVALLIKEARR